MLDRNMNTGSGTMATQEGNVTRGTYFGERDVEKRVYDALIGDGVVHTSEKELCRELAALAGSMYQRRSLSDTDIDEMLYAVAQA
jgi:hypothetical protein